VPSLVTNAPRFLGGGLYRGHPFRIRYMVPLMAIEAIGADSSLAPFLPPRARSSARLPCSRSRRTSCGRSTERRRWSSKRNGIARTAGARARYACMARSSPAPRSWRAWDRLGTTCRKRRGSGLAIRDFLHEGNGDIWLAALQRPQPFAAWMLVEEKAQGGDMLARIAREKPSFSRATSGVCEGAGNGLVSARTKRRYHGRTGTNEAHGSY